MSCPNPFRHLASWVGFSLVAAQLTGCGAPPSDPPSGADTAEVIAYDGTSAVGEISREVGPFRLRWSTTPDPLPFNDLFVLRLEVDDLETGAPVDVQLKVDATMPGHGHGMNVQPVVQELAPGRFMVEGMRFHMAGHWMLHIRLYRDHAWTETAFDLELE